MDKGFNHQTKSIMYSHLNSAKRHCVSSRWTGNADEFEAITFDPEYFGPIQFAVITLPEDSDYGHIILGYKRLNDTSFVFRFHNSDHGGEIEQSMVRFASNREEAYLLADKINRLKPLK